MVKRTEDGRGNYQGITKGSFPELWNLNFQMERAWCPVQTCQKTHSVSVLNANVPQIKISGMLKFKYIKVNENEEEK